MDCDKARDLFTEYHDGELSSEQAQELEAHLASCKDCASEWKEFQQAVGEVSGLMQLSDVELQDDFVHHVKQTIRRRSRGRFFDSESASQGFKLSLITLVLIVVFMMIYILFVASEELSLVGKHGSTTGGVEETQKVQVQEQQTPTSGENLP